MLSRVQRIIPLYPGSCVWWLYNILVTELSRLSNKVKYFEKYIVERKIINTIFWDTLYINALEFDLDEWMTLAFEISNV